MRNLFFVSLFFLLICSCTDDESFDIPSNNPQTRSNFCGVFGDYFLKMEMYTGKYQTLLVTKADGYYVGDVDPFPFYYIQNESGPDTPIISTDCLQYAMGEPSECFIFSNSGLVPSLYSLSYDGQEEWLDTIKLGERIAVWASEKRYRDNDMYIHRGNVDYYTEASLSFKCYFITTLRPGYMWIIFDGERWREASNTFPFPEE